MRLRALPAVLVSGTCLLLLAGAGIDVHAEGTAAVLIHVSPNGNDDWSGKKPSAEGGKDGPVRTLQAAQREARRAIAAAGGKAQVKVEIQPGTYRLASTWRLGPEDSGTAALPTVYEAVKPGTVVLSGGVELSPRGAGAQQWDWTLPTGVAVDFAIAPQLYVNGRRATLAREPNEGTEWFVTKAVPSRADPPNKSGVAEFGASPEAQKWLASLTAADRARAVVDVYQSWTTGRHRLAGVDGDAVQISPPARWPFLTVGTSQRWHVENVRAAFDAPGEWIGDGASVSYKRRSDDAAAPSSAVLAQLDTLVGIKGAADGSAPAQYIQLRGLAFQHARVQTPPGGLLDLQAAVAVGAALEVDDARGIVVDGCRFEHLGGYAVWYRRNVRDSVVSNNVLDDLGAGGVKVGQPKQAPDDKAATGAITVSGNTISDTGHVMPGAVGIWIGQSFDNQVVHNQVSDTTYSGISVGWSWGYDAATSGRNLIANNLLFDIGQGTLSDLGAIYTLGVSPGTIIRGNVIREVRGYWGYGPARSSGAWGIYLDEGTSGATVERNVVVGTDSGGFHLHYGRDLVVKDNLLAWGKTAEFRVSEGDPQTQFAASDNLLVPLSAKPIDLHAVGPAATFANNAVAPVEGRPVPAGDRCGSGCVATKASITAGTDAKSISVANATADMAATVRDTIAQAGPAAPAASARVRATPAAATVRLAPPQGVHLSIDTVAEGKLPPELHYQNGGDPHSLEMGIAPGGGRCLRFVDSATLQHRYDPHAYAVLTYSGGTAEASFRLWLDPNAEFIHEWRDNDDPYHAGPSLKISARGIESGGKVLMPAVFNGWVSFKVSEPLGAPGAKWSLQVTDAAGRVSSFKDLPNASPAFARLDWLGFISNAASSTTTCLGALDISNRN